MRRYLVLLGLFVLSLITYIDRVCISSAQGAVAGDLNLSGQQMGAVFGSFALGYALAQVPSGWLADRIGPRLALALVVIVWSFFTGLTGAVQSLGAMLAVRFLFGVGEAGAFPGSARAVFNWMSVGERGRANGILFSGSRIGAALSFPLLAWMLANYGWRRSFVFLGVAGVVWAVVWLVWFRDHPEKSDSPAKPDVDHAEQSFGAVFRSPAMMLAMFQYFAGNFTFFICLSWMLPYLKDRFSLSDAAAARYAMMPLLFGATAQWVAGFAVDRLHASSWRAWSRRVPAISGFILAVAGMIALTIAGSPAAAATCFALAAFGADLTISPSWTFCQDIGGRNSGAVSGSMNMVGNFGSFASSIAFPWLIALTGSADAYFLLAALLNVAAIVCWLWMRPVSLDASKQPERLAQPAATN